MKERLIAKMINFSAGHRGDIAHFLKVFAYAETIGRLEGLDEATQQTLEIAAVVHDIACPLCREKYGSTDGKLQEKESEALLRPFLAEFSLPRQQEERVIHLVCHHHSYTDVEGMDWRILLEADFLVNADESHYEAGRIAAAEERIFATESGKGLLHSIFPEVFPSQAL